MKFHFINIILETINNYLLDCFKKSFSDFIFIYYWNSVLLKNEVFFKFEILFSFIYNNELIYSIIFFVMTTSSFNVINIIDLININEIFTKYFDIEMI